MQNLLTPEFWQIVLVTAPWVIPFLFVGGIVGWKIKGAQDDGEIRGLKAACNATEAQLKLAEDKQKDITAQVKILEPNSTKLELELAELRGEIAQMKRVLPQLDMAVSTSAQVTRAVFTLSEANNALGATLTPTGAIYSTLPGFSATKKSE